MSRWLEQYNFEIDVILLNSRFYANLLSQLFSKRPESFCRIIDMDHIILFQNLRRKNTSQKVGYTVRG